MTTCSNTICSNVGDCLGVAHSIRRRAADRLTQRSVDHGLGPLDGRVVIKASDGKLHVLKVGDTLPGSQAVIEQVLNDKIVASETITAADKTTKKVTGWISKAAPGGKSSVQRMETEASVVLQPCKRGNNLRPQEIDRYWKAKGRRLVQDEERNGYDPGPAK